MQRNAFARSAPLTWIIHDIGRHLLHLLMVGKLLQSRTKQSVN